jgi:diguanylate cyclase (GGDEF)-like protein/PAS domain S-box-containing protein
MIRHSLNGLWRPAAFVARMRLWDAVRRRPVHSLVVCGGLVACAVTIATALILAHLRERAIADSGRQLQNTAFVLAEQADRAFQAVDILEAGLIEHMRSIGVATSEDYDWHMSGEDVHRLLKEKIASLPHLDAVTVINAAGQLVNFSRAFPIPDINVADRDYFKAFVADPQLNLLISEPVLNRGTGTWTIYMARRVTGQSGAFLGLVLGAMRMSYFEDFYSRAILGSEGSIALFRRDGLMLARYPQVAPSIGQSFAASKVFDALVNAEHGVVQQAGTITPGQRVIAAVSLAHYPVVVTASLPTDAMLAEWRTEAIYLIALTTALVLVIGGTGVVVVRRFREQNVHLDAALNNMRQGLVMFDKNNRLVVVNQRYIEMYGLSPDSVKPGCTLRDVLQQRAASGTFNHNIDEEIAKFGTSRGIEDRTRDLPDGRRILVRNRLTSDHGWLSTHDDITEQRRIELALIAARHEAEEAEQQARAVHERLRDAVEAVPEGFALFDAQGRYVLWNRSYAETYRQAGIGLRAGMPFEDVLRAGIARGLYPDAWGREEEWLADRLARHAQPQSDHEQCLADGRWLRIQERRTEDGGSVGIRIDITELKQREASFRLLFEGNPIPMWVCQPETSRFLAVNDAAIAQYGYTREQFMRMSLVDIRPPEEVDEFRRLAGTPEARYDAGRTWRHIRADGSEMQVGIFSQKLSYEGEPASIVAIVDVTERKQAENALRRTRAFLDTIIENIPATVLVKDARDLRYLLINRAGEQLFGVPREDVIGKTFTEVFSDEKARTFSNNDVRAMAGRDRIFSDTHPLTTPGNGVRLVTSSKLAIAGDNGEPEYVLTVIDDVTARERAEQRVEHLAHHDPLTDLPNRTAFNAHLAAVLERAQAGNEAFAVLSLDLDRFKEINDVFGHPVGDALLRALAERLTAAVPGTFLARVGGDEFSMIVAEGAQPATAEALAAKLQAAVAQDLEIEGRNIRGGLSIGVSIFPGDAAEATALVANADAALYRAKADGRGTIRFFDQSTDKRLRDRRALQHDLESALARRELMLHYQPQARIGGHIVGFEALLRWRHPVHGFIPPDFFIPLAEENGLIVPIGEWVIREACREAASWARPLSIAVNLSPIQFRHGDLPGLIHSILLESGLSPRRLEFEITETALINDFSRAVSILRRLKDLGVNLAMDDFGAGYSSLSNLQSLPFDKIKIDKTFISNVQSSPQSAAIVRTIIGLARGLDMAVLAEGVETKDQLAFLASEDCDAYQGYLLGRPQAIEHHGELIGRSAELERKMILAG